MSAVAISAPVNAGLSWPGATWASRIVAARSIPALRVAIRTLSSLLHLRSTGEDRPETGASADRWVLPSGLSPDELVAELTNRFWDRLRYAAMRRLRDAALAEDVAQETLRRTLEALRAGRVEKPESLPAFLFETARHVCMHRSRSFGREARALQKATPKAEPEAEEDALSGLITEERCTQVRRCLDRLEEPDRKVLALSYDDALAAEEIGRRMGLTAGAVRVRRHRALARLAALLRVTNEGERERD